MRRLLTVAAVALLVGSVARAHSEDRVTSEPPKKPAVPSSIAAAPEFHAAGAVAALTLLLGGVAVLKGWRRE